MIFQIFILALLLLFALNLALNLLFLKRPSSADEMLDPAPFVSILVPARNEEANIERCLDSLKSQDYPAYEILVLDDNSIDKTAEIVSRIQIVTPSIKLLHGKPLPEGWAGKPFACYQLAQQAKGSWILFVDADTMHASYMLRSVMKVAVDQKVSLLSGLPRQMTAGLPQKIVMPFMYFLVLSWFPLWFLNRTRKPWPTLAIGQFMLFPRDEYWKVGGHQAVKNRIIEDVWFGVEIKKAGGKFMSVDLSQVMFTDMYKSIGPMIEGWAKWFYSIIDLSPLALFGLFAIAYLVFLAPFFWLVNGLMMDKQPVDWILIVLAQVLTIVAMRCVVDYRFRGPFFSFVLHPLGLIFLICVALYSTARHAMGAGIAWKDRLYESRFNIK
ncbi:MAG: glycosyltransferase [Dehalococcoidia bacterium]|jgi:chlorobactene glucosyltransferase